MCDLNLNEVLNLNHFEELARTELEAMVYGYYAGGAGSERCLCKNLSAFDHYDLHYKVMSGITKPDLSVEILKETHSSPFLIAPMAFQQMAHPEGELDMARAAAALKITMIASTMSNYPIEQIALAAEGNLWFQLYLFKDRELSLELVRRAETSGCKAIVLTVDAPILGKRERDMRYRFHLPEGMTAANLPVGRNTGAVPVDVNSWLASFFQTQLDGSLSWADLDWLRSKTALPIWVKGIVRADDALLAFEHGAAGVVVSNHGGRQLDSAPATLEVMPTIAQALANHPDQKVRDFPLLLDSGIRRGSDILKGIGLGAKAVLIGRPLLYALSVAGQNGVLRALQLISEELRESMILTGTHSFRQIPTKLVVLDSSSAQKT